MKKNAKSTESNPNSRVDSTPEQIQEYQKLKARNEWIMMNQKYLDQIQKKQLFFHRAIFWLVIVQLFFELINFIL